MLYRNAQITQKSEASFEEKVAHVLKEMGFSFLVRHLDEDLYSTVEWDGKEEFRGEIRFHPPGLVETMQRSFNPTDVAIKIVSVYEGEQHL